MTASICPQTDMEAIKLSIRNKEPHFDINNSNTSEKHSYIINYSINLSTL